MGWMICEWCDGPIKMAARGRIAKFCSTRCRVASHRARTADPVPRELRSRARWVRWREVVRNGRGTKMPIQVDGRAASSTDPGSWVSYSAAKRSGAGDGLGFVLDGD